MYVEQALFTSAQTRHARGYHLVARSSGIPDSLAQTLAVWSPTHDSLSRKSADSQSLNYFVVDDWRVLSRTVYGQSEYSGRGGFRVETNLAVLRAEQLSGYADNPLAIARTMLALGYLRLRAAIEPVLRPLEIPDASLLSEPSPYRDPDQHSELSDRIVEEMREHRVIVIGDVDPLEVIDGVYRRLPNRQRGSLTFTTGLKPSLNRRFDLQFVPTVESHVRRELNASGVRCVESGPSRVLIPSR